MVILKMLSSKTPRFINRNLKHTWIQPDGYDTKIQVYNCVANKKVPLIVNDKNKISWYTCGPTVYDSAHIGHASCYVKLDIIQRILKNYFNLNLITVMNITDIDDKIIKKSVQLNLTPSIVAKKYENEFWNDMSELNISKPDMIVRVTEQIPVILQFINKVIDNGSAYIAEDDSVYFNLSMEKENYGKLVPFVDDEELSDISSDARLKKNKNDFALWKSTKEEEPSWETNFGNGRPGWHSECSALASAIFGDEIDIHAGGMDLKFPHHENEEAISCAYHDNTQWVNYWLHTGYLNLTGEEVKMSKSLKNCIYIKDMLSSRKSASNIFRMACVQSHYKSNMEYSTKIMDTAEANLNKFTSFINDCEAYSKRIVPPAQIKTIDIISGIQKAKNEIDSALKDDFSTSQMLKIMSDFVNDINKMMHNKRDDGFATCDLNDCAIIKYAANFISSQLDLLGFSSIKLTDVQGSEDMANILNLINTFRQSIRNYGIKNKNKELLQYCDTIRDELKICGIEIKDRGEFSSWNKV